MDIHVHTQCKLYTLHVEQTRHMYLSATRYPPQCSDPLLPHCGTTAKPRHSGAPPLERERERETATRRTEKREGEKGKRRHEAMYEHEL